MNYVDIQIQDGTGNWRTFSVTQNIPAMIVAEMRQLKNNYPEFRVRAVDNVSGQLIDILT